MHNHFNEYLQKNPRTSNTFEYQYFNVLKDLCRILGNILFLSLHPTNVVPILDLFTTQVYFSSLTIYSKFKPSLIIANSKSLTSSRTLNSKRADMSVFHLLQYHTEYLLHLISMKTGWFFDKKEPRLVL